VTQCAEWLEPYREQMALITPGNHETAVRKRMETCLTTRLVEQLRVRGSKCRAAGYSGWVMFRARSGKTNTALYRLWYHHGYGTADAVDLIPSGVSKSSIGDGVNTDCVTNTPGLWLYDY